jgi:crotonobetainyl-CoA:carnitine CoA-transferase CaiB-like acyl-CoA transferase
MTEAVACTCPSDAVAEYSANGAIRGELSVSKAGAPLISYTVWYLKERLLCIWYWWCCHPTGPMGNTHPRHAPHSIYRAAGDENQWIAVAVQSDTAWAALVSTSCHIHLPVRLPACLPIIQTII